MRNTWAVCKREFKSFFLTPIGYVVVGMVALISGMAFTLSLLTFAKVSQAPADYAYATVPDFEETLLSPFLVFCGILIMFLSPLLTMRLLAEERHKGTIEMLLTYPLRDREVIFGKYLAAMGMIFVMMLVFGVDLLIVFYFVTIEPAVLVFGLLAVFLMGASVISLGLFVSSVTRNQITSGTISFGICLVLYILGNLGDKLPVKNPVPEAWPAMLRDGIGTVYAVARGVVMEMPLDAHAKDMALGVARPVDIAYYVLFSAFFLFLTFRALESRNWRS
jgi:ABC-2 type transport system permease protein